MKAPKNTSAPNGRSLEIRSASTISEPCRPISKSASLLAMCARFYRMSSCPNLFGEWTLQVKWGRHRQGGQVRMDWFSMKANRAALITLEASKRQRVVLGGGLSSWQCCKHLKDPKYVYIVSKGDASMPATRPVSLGDALCQPSIDAQVGERALWIKQATFVRAGYAFLKSMKRR